MNKFAKLIGKHLGQSLNFNYNSFEKMVLIEHLLANALRIKSFFIKAIPQITPEFEVGTEIIPSVMYISEYH